MRSRDSRRSSVQVHLSNQEELQRGVVQSKAAYHKKLEQIGKDLLHAAMSPQPSYFLKVRSVRPALSSTFVESELHTRHTMKRSKNKKKSKDIRKEKKRGPSFYTWGGRDDIHGNFAYACPYPSIRRRKHPHHNEMKRNRATRGFPYIKERWDVVQPKTTAVSSLHVKPRHRHLAYESDQIDKYAKLIANVDERFTTVDKVPEVSVEELEAMWTGHPSNMSLEMASWSDQVEDGEGGGW